MATAKKTVTKAAKPAAKAKAPAAPKKPPEPQYSMPMEVKNWIERAQSIMNHQKGEIERLKKENTDLKAYKRWAEHRILRSDHE
jgi:hypothetical protein